MTAMTPSFLIGLDLGERRDYTALSVLQQRLIPGSRMAALVGDPDTSHLPATSVHQYRYDVIDLDRWRQQGYSVIPAKLREIMQHLRQLGFDQQHADDQFRSRSVEPIITILVDHTGVGVAVVEEIRNAGIECVGITIHGGDVVNHDDDNYRVPKRDIVSRTQVLLETDRLKIAKSLALAPTLVAEFDNFKAKKAILTGHDSYGAGADWREGNHDDLVLSVAMAAWFGEHHATEDVEHLQSHIALANYLRASGHPGYR